MKCTYSEAVLTGREQAVEERKDKQLKDSRRWSEGGVPWWSLKDGEEIKGQRRNDSKSG